MATFSTTTAEMDLGSVVNIAVLEIANSFKTRCNVWALMSDLVDVVSNPAAVT